MDAEGKSRVKIRKLQWNEPLFFGIGKNLSQEGHGFGGEVLGMEHAGYIAVPVPVVVDLRKYLPECLVPERAVALDDIDESRKGDDRGTR